MLGRAAAAATLIRSAVALKRRKEERKEKKKEKEKKAESAESVECAQKGGGKMRPKEGIEVR